MFTAQGATLTTSGTSGTLTATGPIMMSRSQIPFQATVAGVSVTGTYSESLSFSGAMSVAVVDGHLELRSNAWADRGTVNDDALLNLVANATSGYQYTVQSLSRSLQNIAGQPVESDGYDLITNANYLANGANNPRVTATTSHYYATTYGYDGQGRLAETVNPNLTITVQTYDALGRSLGTYVGTNDVPSSNLNALGGTNWEDFIYGVNTSPTTIPAGTNMTLVSLNQYDGGGVGDSNLTQTTSFIDAGTTSASQRVTQFLYDWRNRAVTAKQGVLSVLGNETAGTLTHRPLTIQLTDNLGEVTDSFRFDGDGISLTDTNHDGVPDVLDNNDDGVPTDSDLNNDSVNDTSSHMRAYSVMAYDEQGRAFRTLTYTVNQTNGSYDAATDSTYAIVSNTWFDLGGNTIASHTSGGPMSKMAYDGVGRVTRSYVTDGGAVNNNSTVNGHTILAAWADAASVNKDVVLEQTDYLYDTNGNVVMTQSHQRFDTDASTATGPLGDAITGTAPTVADAGFESMTNWFASGTAGQVANASTITASQNAPEGTHAGYLGGAGSVLLQGFTFAPGTYAVKFQASRGQNTGTDSQRFEVYISNGSTSTRIGNYTPDLGYVAYQTDTFEISASGTYYVLFGGWGATGQYALIDAVSVVAAPAARRSFALNYYDAASRLTDAVNVGTNGGWLTGTGGFGHGLSLVAGPPTTLPSRTDSGYTVLITSYSYNGAGQLSVVMDPRGIEARTEYDALGRTTKTVANYHATNTATLGESGQDLETYKYLGLSTVVERAHPQAHLTLTYNAQGVEGIGDAGDKYTGLDRFGRILDQRWIDTTGGGYTAVDRYTYTYDADSNRITKTNVLRANGTNGAYIETYAYDGLNRLTDLTPGGGGEVTQGWTLDAMGNFAGTARTVGGVTTTQNRTHNSDNQITGISTTVGTSSAVTTVLSYDNNGNTTKDDLGHTLVYDAWNRLTQVKDAALTLKTYSYDAVGRRATEAAPQTNPTELYYSVGWQVIEEDTGASGVTLQSQTVYSPVYSDAIVLRDYDFDSSAGTSFSISERVYATQDANFNVTGLITFHTLDGDANGDGTINVGELGVLATNYGKTKPGGDAAGDYNHDGKIDVTDLGIYTSNTGHSSTSSGWTVAERIAYDPYGTFDVRKGSDWTAQSNEYLGWVNFHQGLRLDRDTGSKVSNAWVIGTGWYDSRGRVYSPTLGRFGQGEPSGAAYIDGTNLNWAYAGNPINEVDWSGLDAGPSIISPQGATAIAEASKILGGVSGALSSGALATQTIFSIGIVTGVTITATYTLAEAAAELSRSLRITGYAQSWQNFAKAKTNYATYGRAGNKVECPCKNSLNLTTDGLSLAGKLDVVAYALYTNIWIKDHGGTIWPVSTTTTMGPSGKPLAEEAEGARDAERKRRPRMYPWVLPDGPKKAAGHVPDTIISGIADPGATYTYTSPFMDPFWMPMDNRANSRIGSQERPYIGKPISCVTVDGQDPNALTFIQFKAPKP